MPKKRNPRVLIKGPSAILNRTKTLVRAYWLRGHRDNQSSHPFVHDRTFWYGLIGLAVTVAMMLWLKNADVHGSRLLDVARTVTERYEILGIFFMLYIGGTLIPVPIDPIFVFALTLPQGPLVMGALALFANLLGSLTNFYLARLLGHDWVSRETGHRHTKRLVEWFDANGPLALVVFGILPLPVFDVLTVFAGLSAMEAGKFLLYSIVGRAAHFAILAVVALKVFGI